MDLTYLVRGADGKQYGPASLEELSKWIADGRVPANQEVQRSDMEYWAAAQDFTELKPFFGQAQQAAPSHTAVATAPGSMPRSTPSASDIATVAQMRSGGSWFYWIAGLSLINTISAMSGATFGFVVGLGITRIFDQIGQGLGGNGKIVALILDLLVAGMFVAFGVFANKGHLWAFIVGMILFALDGLIFVIGGLWIGVAFHAFVVYCLFRGFAAARELRRG